MVAWMRVSDTGSSINTVNILSGGRGANSEGDPGQMKESYLHLQFGIETLIRSIKKKKKWDRQPSEVRVPQHRKCSNFTTQWV